MAGLKWPCIGLVMLLSLAMCSALMVETSPYPPTKPEITNEPHTHSHVTSPAPPTKPEIASDPRTHSGGGGGGGWSSGGTGFGGNPGAGGYGYGGGSGGGGGGGGGGGWSSGGQTAPGFDGNNGGGGGSGSGGGYGWGSGGNGYYPIPVPGFGIPGVPGSCHCQPITCGNPNGCPGFTLYIPSKPVNAAAKNMMPDAMAPESA